MPQVTLEYSNNISQTVDFDAVFRAIHQLLVKVIDANIESCKSRAVEQSHYFIGSGGDKKAFVYLHIEMLAGRALEKRQALGEQAQALLKEYYIPSSKDLELQISVRVSDMDSDTYFKT